MGPATELMLDLAGIETGYRVLDIAAGTGDQSIEAAKRAGPNGYVLATDLSLSMLNAAAKAAQGAGFTNIETRVADAQTLDLEPASFDAAICRLGLMFFPDQTALGGLRRALKPGARFAAVVWSLGERNPVLHTPLRVVERRIGPQPAVAMHLALSMGEPGVLENTLKAAGFRDVWVQAVPANRRAVSLEILLQTMRGGPAGETISLLPEAQREDAWAEVAAELRRCQSPNGVEVPGELLVGVGTN